MDATHDVPANTAKTLAASKQTQLEPLNTGPLKNPAPRKASLHKGNEMSIKVTLAAFALAVSIPALASAAQGNDQLAKIAGVSLGEYSTAELVLIDAARHNTNAEYLNFLLAHGSNNEVSTTSAGAVMLAKNLGVAPGFMSVADLIILDDAIRDGDETRIAFQLAKTNPDVSRSGINATPSAGHIQIAKLAGVEPGRLSTGDLNRLIDAQRSGDVVLVKYLLNK
jgi:hypothetical protein